MALKKLQFGGDPPDWVTDKNKVGEFQDWVNKTYPNTINLGTNGKYRGKYGPQTTAAWNKYGSQYNPTPSQLPKPGTQNTAYFDKTGWHYPNLSASLKPVIQEQQEATAMTNISKGFGDYMRKRSIASKDNIPDTDVFDSKGVKTGAYKNEVFVPDPNYKTKDGFTEGMNKLGEKAGPLIPFVTNIVNTFRKPPKVPMPNLNPQVTLQKVNYDNDRYAVERGIRGSDKMAEMNLDENTASAVKQYNLAQRFNQLSQVNQAERNQNVEISNKQNLINADIVAGNNAKLDQQGRDQVEMQVARQRESSANLANAADKYQAIQNEKSKANLDKDKLDVIRMMYNKEGVAGRTDEELKMAKENPEAYTKLLEERRKLLLTTTIGNQKKYGGTMKYSTGGMMKVFADGGSTNPIESILGKDKMALAMKVLPYVLETGGSINIKPENRGKFTAWAKSNGMGVQEAASKVMAHKEDYSPTIVKRANFAKNFAH